jgi:hypothetical protein
MQRNNAQIKIWQSLLQVSTHKDSKEIYFIFLLALVYFILLLES